MAIAAALSLRAGDRARLEALARAASARPGLSQRARIVLMAADGLTNTEIACRTGSTRPTVINWRKRYASGGINALSDLPRSGRPAVVDELGVVATTLADGGRPPAHLGVSYWSSRLLGQHLGISFATVSRIWRKWGIRPDHVITQPAIRRGTSTLVHDLIEALGAVTDDWPDRQTTFDPNDDPPQGSSRSVENGLSRDRERDLEPSAGRAPESVRSAESVESRSVESKSVRAEFHGTRARRSPTVPPH